jgi:microcystin-dependent protein
VAEDRPVQDPVSELAQLRRDFEDFKTTMAVRASRPPVGTIAVMPWPTPPAGVLYLQGQTVLRAAYPVLWQLVQDRNAVGTSPGQFGAGDGSTTFTLPDWRGRAVIGAGTLGADTYTLGQIGGAARITLTTSQMPSHSHSASTGSDSHDHGSAGGHSHTTDTSGSHGGHTDDSGLVPTGTGADVADNFFHSAGSHSHGTSTNGSHTHASDSHSHTVSVGSTGSGSDVDVRQPFVAANYAIWT